MPHEVRPHTRRTPGGKTAKVRRHTRDGDAAEKPQKVKRKRGPSPGHAGKLGRRAVIHGKRGRKAKAGAYALLAAGEVAAWLTLSGTSLILALVAGALAAVSVALTV